jgi:hypothetical protein
MNTGGVPQGCTWENEHTLKERMDLFDRLPKHIRDKLNYDDPDGAWCIHCWARYAGIRPPRRSGTKHKNPS